MICVHVDALDRVDEALHCVEEHMRVSKSLQIEQPIVLVNVWRHSCKDVVRDEHEVSILLL